VTVSDALLQIVEIGELGPEMSDTDVEALMERIPIVFRQCTIGAGYPARKVAAIVTKLRDAGRRSPPTVSFSSIGPGRPQNAADGNRANRWTLPSDHKYYATKRVAQLVEIRYYLQALSLSGAPHLNFDRSVNAFTWLLGHELRPGAYIDPIMLREIDFPAFAANPATLTSGHLIPLNRGGAHAPENTFLMLARSNTLQNDLTFAEFLALIDDILRRQAQLGNLPDPEEIPSHAFLESTPGRAVQSD
jgi:hypothetical protein